MRISLSLLILCSGIASAASVPGENFKKPPVGAEFHGSGVPVPPVPIAPATLKSDAPGAPAPDQVPGPLPAPAVPAPVPVPVPEKKPVAPHSGLASVVPPTINAQDVQKVQADLTALYDKGRLTDASIESFVASVQGTLSRHGRPAVLRPEGMPTDDQVDQNMRSAPMRYEDRLAMVAEILTKNAGVKPEELVYQDVDGQKNIYWVKKGSTDRVIVIGSHHDKVDGPSHGTIDNWTGSMIMAHLSQVMRELDTEATYIFASFAREEDGLLGSAQFVRSLAQDAKQKINAMLNFDTLAVDGTYTLKNTPPWRIYSSQLLLDLFRKVAEAEKLPLEEVELEGGDADSSSFKEFTHAITVLGARPPGIFDKIHSAADNMSEFSLPHYINALKLGVAVLMYLNHHALPPFEAAARS